MVNTYMLMKGGEMEYVYDDSKSPAANASASMTQVGGNHYVSHTIQPLDIIDEYGLDFYLGNSIKYILRDKDNKREDIDKAIHYLELYKERRSLDLPKVKERVLDE